jgi:hypothetical protein
MSLTYLQKIAAAGAFAASNQFLGTGSMGTPGAGAAGAKLPQLNSKITTPGLGGAGSGMGTGGPISAPALAGGTGATLQQETITHGDSQNKINTAPITPGMIHPTHPKFS